MQVINDLCTESKRNDWPVVQINNAADCEQRMSVLVIGKQRVRPSNSILRCTV